MSSIERAAVSGPAQVSVSEVQALVSRVTRYPQELLSPDADLEDELGIDSVKLQEILAALEQAFPSLSPLQDRGPRPRSLRELTGWVSDALRASAEAAPAPQPPSEVASEVSARDRAHTPERPFEGKIALVSGSGQGLGRVTALELARGGASLIINSFHHRELGERVAQEITNAGDTARHVWASMARTDHVDRLFDQIGEQFGGLDFFIHNASNGVFAELREVNEEHWLKSFRTNVIGFHRGAIRAAELMRGRGGGKILSLSSVYEDATMDYFGVQGPVKASLESLTRFLAKEFLKDNIQVNCVSFGAIDGHTMTLYPDAERIRAKTEARSQGHRRMTEIEAARAELLFLSAAADSITGSVIRVDRGMMVSL